MRPDLVWCGGGSFALLSFEPGWVGSWWKEEESGSQLGFSHKEDLASVETGDASGAGLQAST